jgi:hypothetical protein
MNFGFLRKAAMVYGISYCESTRSEKWTNKCAAVVRFPRAAPGSPEAARPPAHCFPSTAPPFRPKRYRGERREHVNLQ